MELMIELKAKPDRAQELYQTLQALLPTFRRAKGCRHCRIYQGVEDGSIFFLSAQWEAQENLGQYLQSSNGRAFVGAIDMLSEKAAIKTCSDARWEGAEKLKKIRKSIFYTPVLGREKGTNRGNEKAIGCEKEKT